MIYLQKTVFYKGGSIVRQKKVLQGNSKLDSALIVERRWNKWESE